MVAILEKSEHNIDFQPMVDFVEASPLRRNLKLQDEEGISSLPDTELFENLTLMRYNISSHQWKFLIHTIMQCLSPKSTGFNEFSSNIATALVCLATNRTYNFSKMIFNGLVKNGEGSGTPTEPHHIPSQEAQPSSHTHISSPSIPTITSIPTIPILTVIPSETTPIRKYTRRARIAQSSALLPIADEPASSVRDASQGEAFPTDSGFIADQDRATIAKSSTLPYDSAPRVTSPAAKEGTQEVEINMLKERVKILEDKRGVIGDRSRDDAPIKGRRIDEEEVATERVSSDTEEVRLDEREVAAERASEDTEEMATVLTTKDASTVLASKTAEVSTGSGSILTAGPPAAEVPTGSDVVPTGSPVFATATVVGD
nr:synaptobrevin, longin-like domain protein [Tanacetum cinerariifolium]